MSYTKGPWYIEMTNKIDGNDVSHAICHGINEYADGPAGQVCLATSGRRADADLIAAAPDLYEALKAAIECGMVPASSAREGGALRHLKQAHVADQIRAALAKAEGIDHD